eukprot:5420739-Amphidinium_carterae.1
MSHPVPCSGPQGNVGPQRQVGQEGQVHRKGLAFIRATVYCAVYSVTEFISHETHRYNKIGMIVATCPKLEKRRHGIMLFAMSMPPLPVSSLQV